MAGANMKDIKLRIRSVESTMQITKAMQLVATSKLRRAKERMEQSRPYIAISLEAMQSALSSCTDETVPYLKKRDVKKRCYVIIAGDRGLAGGYNNNIFKMVASHSEGVRYCVLPLGRKAIEKYQRVGTELLSEDYPRVEGITVGMCYKLAKLLTASYLAEQFDEIWLVYTDFQNMLSQTVKLQQLLPIQKPAETA